MIPGGAPVQRMKGLLQFYCSWSGHYLKSSLRTATSSGSVSSFRNLHTTISNSYAVATQTQGSESSQEELVLSYVEKPAQGKIAVLGMNRPKAKNSFGKNIVQRFYDALDSIQFDKEVRVVVIRSLVPGIFCAGADLKERLQMKPEDVGPFVARMRTFVTNLENLPIPVIAALDGAALGGGLELALACDLRVASSTAKMGLVETKLAIIPGNLTDI